MENSPPKISGSKNKILKCDKIPLQSRCKYNTHAKGKCDYCKDEYWKVEKPNHLNLCVDYLRQQNTDLRQNEENLENKNEILKKQNKQLQYKLDQERSLSRFPLEEGLFLTKCF